ncbi:MAG: hypothetical protein D6729_00250 [Deltaproteobacteria bacterium]|nr:MAG: hypothetical protein D6729_00250 [Deltaproteobacteria bacterium]
MSGELKRLEVDTLAEAYERLAEAEVERAAVAARAKEARRRLEQRAHYVLGSLEAAERFLDEGDEVGAGEGQTAGGRSTETGEGRGASPALARREALQTQLAETRAAFARERAALEEELRTARLRAEEIFAAAQAAVVERVEAYLEHARPHLSVEVAHLADGRRVVHLRRPERETSVLLCRLLAGRPPGRLDFLSDESVDRVEGPVYLAQRTPEVDPEAIHAGGADAEDGLLALDGPLLPIRAHIPVRLPKVAWPHLRLRTRGAVLELESREEGEPYTHLVPEAHAELFTGFLVSLQVRGRLTVEIDVP